MFRIELRNITKGITFDIEPNNASCNYQIYSEGLIGFDIPTFNVYSESSAHHNESEIIGRNAPYRELTIKMCTKTNQDLYTRINELGLFFNPDDDYLIIVYLGDTSRYMYGVLSGYSAPIKNINKTLDVTVSFFCDYPYWINSSTVSKTMDAAGTSLNYTEFTDLTLEKSVAPVFKMQARTSSTITAFTLKCGLTSATQSTLTFEGSEQISTTERLEIDLRNRTATIGDTDIFPYITGWDTLNNFYVNYGQNRFEFRVNLGSTGNDCWIEYQKEHLSCL